MPENECTNPMCEDGIITEMCGNCAGSGEGMYDGSTCTVCKGSGVSKAFCDCKRGQEREIDDLEDAGDSYEGY